MVRVRILIEGRVQGVGFRYCTCAEAQSLGLCGWVRNLPDGCVETEFEGSEEAVRRMETWCHHGPASARVRSATVVSRETCEPKFHGFSIRG